MTKPWDPVKVARGQARRAHLESATLALWRGRPARFKDKRKHASKRACRGKHNETE